MKTPEEIKRGLECARNCEENDLRCRECPYLGSDCSDLHPDALAYIQQLEAEKFDVLNEISAAYYGKQMYYLNDDGTVYSRYSCEEMTFDEAVSEMAGLLYERYE